VQENDPLKSNNYDDQPHTDSEPNDQQPLDLEQAKPTQDTPQEQPSAPSKSANLPAWLRAEMGEPPEEQEKQSTEQKPDVTDTEREVQQLRAQVTGYQQQLASAQRQVHVLSSRTAYRDRGGCLTAWLLLLGTGSLIGLLIGLIAFSQSVILGGILLIGGAVSFAGVSGTWRLKKWGYNLLMTLYVINIVIGVLGLCVSSSLSLGSVSSLGSIVGALVAMLILFLLVHDRWEAFE